MRTINLTLDGRDGLSLLPLWAWQSNPLTLDCAVGSALELLPGAVNFCAQIHTSAIADGATPLVSKTVAADPESVTFEFNTEEMDFAVTGAAHVCWLFITALDAGENEMQTLFARRIEIKAASWSRVAPSGITVSNGVASVTLGGTVYSWPVEASSGGAGGGSGLSVSNNIISVRIGGTVYSWPAGTLS